MSVGESTSNQPFNDMIMRGESPMKSNFGLTNQTICNKDTFRGENFVTGSIKNKDTKQHFMTSDNTKINKNNMDLS